MSNTNSSAYYLGRADRQTRLAEAATTAGVRSIHRELAARYLQLAEAASAAAPRPRLRLAM